MRFTCFIPVRVAALFVPADHKETKPLRTYVIHKRAYMRDDRALAFKSLVFPGMSRPCTNPIMRLRNIYLLLKKQKRTMTLYIMTFSRNFHRLKIVFIIRPRYHLEILKE